MTSVKNPLDEMRRVFDDLKHDRISRAEAFQQMKPYTGKKAWGSTAWKKMREQFIGTQCAACSSQEGPFVLQHLRQPIDLKILGMFTFDEYKKERPFEIDISDTSLKKRAACPKCQSINLRYRAADKCTICNRCHEIVVPIMIPDPKDRSAKKQEAYKAFSEKRFREYLADEEWQKRPVLAWIAEMIRYWSCTDAVTYCQKCAYLSDVKGMEICPVCKQHYKSRRWPTCYQCHLKKKEG